MKMRSYPSSACWTKLCTTSTADRSAPPLERSYFSYLPRCERQVLNEGAPTTRHANDPHGRIHRIGWQRSGLRIDDDLLMTPGRSRPSGSR
jgi:hypothetical protein